MGKNTMMRRSIRLYCERTGNDQWLQLLDHMIGNVGLIFTKGDLNEVRDGVVAGRDGWAGIALGGGATRVGCHHRGNALAMLRNQATWAVPSSAAWMLLCGVVVKVFGQQHCQAGWSSGSHARRQASRQAGKSLQHRHPAKPAGPLAGRPRALLCRCAR